MLRIAILRNCAGNDNNAIFIENGKYHGGIITQSILSKSKHHLKVKDRSINSGIVNKSENDATLVSSDSYHPYEDKLR